MLDHPQNILPVLDHHECQTTAAPSSKKEFVVWTLEYSTDGTRCSYAAAMHCDGCDRDALRLHHAASGSMVPLVNLDAWEGDDESYTYALHATLKTIGTVSGQHCDAGLLSVTYILNMRAVHYRSHGPTQCSLGIDGCFRVHESGG